jgi:hypothetical protein
MPRRSMRRGPQEWFVQICKRQDDTAHNLQSAYLGSNVAARQIAALARSVEHRHHVVQASRIGGWVVDALQNLLILHQDVAQPP